MAVNTKADEETPERESNASKGEVATSVPDVEVGPRVPKVKMATNDPEMDVVTRIPTVDEGENDPTVEVATEVPKVGHGQEEIKKDHLLKQHQGVQMRGKESVKHMPGKEEIKEVPTAEVDKAMNVDEAPEMGHTKREDAEKVDNDVTVDVVASTPGVEGADIQVDKAMNVL